MKNISKNNWALWLLMASVFMMMALAAREVAVEKGFEPLYVNVVFVSTFSILIALYAIIIDILTPIFDLVFKKWGFMASTKKELAKAKNNDNLVIDYAWEKVRSGRFYWGYRCLPGKPATRESCGRC